MISGMGFNMGKCEILLGLGLTQVKETGLDLGLYICNFLIKKKLAATLLKKCHLICFFQTKTKKLRNLKQQRLKVLNQQNIEINCVFRPNIYHVLSYKYTFFIIWSAASCDKPNSAFTLTYNLYEFFQTPISTRYLCKSLRKKMWTQTMSSGVKAHIALGGHGHTTPPPPPPQPKTTDTPYNCILK